jgi:hypothetical protein
MAFLLPRKGRALNRGCRIAAALLLCAGALLPGGRASAQENGAMPRQPTADELFRVESEYALRQRMIAEARAEKRETPIFPPAPAVQAPFPGRFFAPNVAHAEASYVCYGRLLFEQINAERYGWDLGPIHPLLSMGKFYLDVAMLPYNLATAPCRCYECSNYGYCLPGSPVPLVLYPPELSLTGAAAEGAAIALLLAIFP